jgi:hypothetical protein
MHLCEIFKKSGIFVEMACRGRHSEKVFPDDIILLGKSISEARPSA